MKQNCLRLTRLINNLIDTTRIDAGYLELQLQRVNIVEYLKKIALAVEEYAKNKGITLEFNSSISEKVITCDPDKLETIVLNLLSNAIKFTKNGGKIFINLEAKESIIQISVKDTGIGIPKSKLKIIFERFRQVEQSLVRNHEGSGIGLSLVKSLVELHNGKIYVLSEEDAGSEFVIELPIENVSIDSSDCTYNIVNSGGVDKIDVEFSDNYMSKSV